MARDHVIEGELASRRTVAAILTGEAIADVHAFARKADDVLLRTMRAEQADDGRRRELAADRANGSIVGGDEFDLAEEVHADGSLPRDDSQRLIALVEEQRILHSQRKSHPVQGSVVGRSGFHARDSSTTSARLPARSCMARREN